MDPEYLLQRAMRHSALAEIRGADLVLQMHPLPEAPAPDLGALLPELGATPPRLLVYSKGDLVSGAPPKVGDALVVSAQTREGLDTLLAAVRARLPEGPFLYDGADVGTQPLRFFAAEYVREAAFDLLEQELPYCVAVELDAFRESEEPVYIRATLAVERESQKPIVLGKGGRTIKAIGIAARRRIEALLERRVRLELWVTVWPKWRRDAARLAQLGLSVPHQEPP
jgi:GTP-binding protein Era